MAADDRRHAPHAPRRDVAALTAPFLDSHAHLADPAFDADRAEVMARARSAGAAGIVCIGESLEAAERARRLAEADPNFLFWTVGVHPHDAAGFDAIADSAAIRAALDAGAVAVGECGLDYHYDHSPRDRQRLAFSAQLAIAGESKRPVVVHTREAEADTMAMVAEAGRAGIRGVMHCFTGSAALAQTALEAGWYLSFAGIVTFKKWEGAEIVRTAPLNRILVESDSPYLAPTPNRGKRNEPAWCAQTVQRLAEVRQVTPDELGRATVENAQHLFSLPS